MCEKIQNAVNYLILRGAGNYLINNEKLFFSFGYYVTLGIMALGIMSHWVFWHWVLWH